MNENSLFRRLASPLLVLPILIGSLALAVPAGAEEEKSASAGDVAAGLKQIQSIAESTAKAAEQNGPKAEQLTEGIEPVWEKIEGTLRSNDKDAYVKLEDNFTLLKIGAKAGDAARAATASENVAAAVTSYLGKYPAPAGADAPEASSSETRSAAAAEAPEKPLPRTGPVSASLLALAGMAIGIGGLATIGGARRHGA